MVKPVQPILLMMCKIYLQNQICGMTEHLPAFPAIIRIWTRLSSRMDLSSYEGILAGSQRASAEPKRKRYSGRRKLGRCQVVLYADQPSDAAGTTIGFTGERVQSYLLAWQRVKNRQ